MYEHYFKRYIIAAAVYGFTRKVCRLHGAHVKEYDCNANKDVVKPMLWCDKVLITTMGTICGPLYFPMNVYLDARSLELKLRNDDCTKTTSFIEHLMA